MLEANQKIYFVLTDGTRYQLTRRELFWIFSRKEFLSLAFSMISFMAILDFHNLGPEISAPFRIIHWSVIGGIYAATLYFFMIICYQLLKLIFPMSGQIHLTSVIPTFCAIVITTPIGILISQLFGKEKHFTNSTLLEEFALNFLVGLGIDFIFAIFILPFMAIQNRAIQTTSSQALTINGKDLCLKNVHFLRASGRGTIIKSDDGETNFAEKFSDVVSRLPSEEGILIHRSFWVPYAQISDFRTHDRRTVCQLISGDVLPVARSRYPLIRNELKSRKKL